MITVGLDFGTHQTKICVEDKNGVELKYTFFKFEDNNHDKQYTLPSIIGQDRSGLLHYGYLPKGYKGNIVRYFKQSAFGKAGNARLISQENAMYFSIWYIAYILFDLEEMYGQEFTIQMGAPTDSSHVDHAKQIATQIIISAYRLVEEIFNNDKKKFLATTLTDLVAKTEIIPYSKEAKDEYGLLVFPEAYACLKPLISQKKISFGMSLMIDIGGGTTDISFFTIEKGVPQVYDFYSLPKGLNYLTLADEKEDSSKTDSNVRSAYEISLSRKSDFESEVKRLCLRIREKLLKEYNRQTELNNQRLFDALKRRPLIYTGGGSTFSVLRKTYEGFVEKRQVSEKEWNTKSICDMNEITFKGLCPILSTAYGLSISTEHDNIKMKPFRDIFDNIRGASEKKPYKRDSSFGSALGGFNYADDWDAWK